MSDFFKNEKQSSNGQTTMSPYEKKFREDPESVSDRFANITDGVKADVKSKYSNEILADLFAKRGLKFTEGDEERVIEMIMSDGRADFDGDILHPKGWDIKTFKKNPQFFWMHNPREEPIGNVITEEVRDRKGINEDTPDHLKQELIGLPYFARTAKADGILALYKSGILRASSVGFRFLKIKTVTEEQRRELKLGRWGIFSLKQRLKELSGVTLPANSGAVVTAKSVDTDLYQKLYETLDQKLEMIANRLEGLKTVKEINLRFDELVAMVKTLMEGDPKTSSRTESLYGDVDMTYTQLEDSLAKMRKDLNKLES
jgi:hypothetical protein